MSEVTLAASLEGPPGAPVLVLGNSIGTARSLWDRQAGVLRRHFRLLRYEFRGHGGPGGASPAPPGPYTIAELGADVLGLLNSHGISRAAYCGVSLGGMVGMWLAANAPERIASLAVCCSSAYLPPASMWTERAAKVRSEGMASIAGQAVARWFTPGFARRNPEAVAAVVAMLTSTDPEGYAGCAEAIAAMDLRPSLPSITAPTLVVAAAEDPATPPPHGALIARAVPGARLAVLRGTSHLASYQTPAEVTAVLLRHLLPTAAGNAAHTG
ncbi:MAG TPA: 3-oxoadipate enol-lactonase [Streptosporangiaceae bacterium]|nr:3-oxoadipate enol-lactonase [Streptosporangiaceae bacterium]